MRFLQCERIASRHAVGPLITYYLPTQGTYRCYLTRGKYERLLAIQLIHGYGATRLVIEGAEEINYFIKLLKLSKSCPRFLRTFKEEPYLITISRSPRVLLVKY